MHFFYTYSLCTGVRWNASGRWSYTSDTRWDEEKSENSIYEFKKMWFIMVFCWNQRQTSLPWWWTGQSQSCWSRCSLTWWQYGKNPVLSYFVLKIYSIWNWNSILSFYRNHISYSRYILFQIGTQFDYIPCLRYSILNCSLTWWRCGKNPVLS